VGDVSEVESLLVGTKYDRTEIAAALKEIDIPTYFGGITEEDFLQLIY